MGSSPFDGHDTYDDTDDDHVVGNDLAALDVFDYRQPQADAVEEPLFTVTNPPGTVTVSAHFDGRVQRIELSPEVASTSEDQLATEIVVIAGLATQRARAAQFSYMLEGMQDNGHDTVDTRDFLNRSVGLPSPEEADAARAQIFATRYAGDHD